MEITSGDILDGENLDKVSPVQRSNQLRYRYVVVELTADVHV